MQRSGLEWIWRIYEEPKLWRRYIKDGLSFLLLVIRRILPYAIWRFFNKAKLNSDHEFVFDVNRSKDLTIFFLQGVCVEQSIDPLRQAFKIELENGIAIRLDLSAVSVVDGAFLGLCLVLAKNLNRKGLDLQFVGINMTVRRIFHWNCVDYLL